MFRAGTTSMRKFRHFSCLFQFGVGSLTGKMCVFVCFYNISAESYITTCNNAEKDGLSAVDSFILSNDWKSLPKSITDRNNVQHVKLTETV